METIKDLLQKRAAIHNQMNELLTTAQNENRDMTKEEDDKFNTMDKDFEKLTRDISLREKMDKRDALMAERHGESIGDELPDSQRSEDPKENAERYSVAFRDYVRNGLGDMSPENREILKAGLVKEDRAQSTSNTAGGYTIPQGFRVELEKAMKVYGGVRGVSRVITTDSGNELEWPTVNDTANVSAILAENGNADAATTDVTFGQKALNAYKTNPGVLRTSRELLTDSALNVEQILGELMGERTGRFENQWFTTGTGSSQPNGCVTASTLGKTAASATAITYSEILDLLHSVDPAYRNNARFMFNDLTLLYLKKLVIGTADARPLWTPSIREGEPDMIAGKPYTINQDMANIATAAKTILFGDFSKFIIRDVGTPYFRRLDERYADYDQVGWILFTRVDSELIDAGAGAIKHLLQA